MPCYEGSLATLYLSPSRVCPDPPKKENFFDIFSSTVVHVLIAFVVFQIFLSKLVKPCKKTVEPRAAMPLNDLNITLDRFFVKNRRHLKGPEMCF
jgi:hypothetical protein